MITRENVISIESYQPNLIYLLVCIMIFGFFYVIEGNFRKKETDYSFKFSFREISKNKIFSLLIIFLLIFSFFSLTENYFRYQENLANTHTIGDFTLDVFRSYDLVENIYSVGISEFNEIGFEAYLPVIHFEIYVKIPNGQIIQRVALTNETLYQEITGKNPFGDTFFIANPFYRIYSNNEVKFMDGVSSYEVNPDELKLRNENLGITFNSDTKLISSISTWTDRGLRVPQFGHNSSFGYPFSDGSRLQVLLKLARSEENNVITTKEIEIRIEQKFNISKNSFSVFKNEPHSIHTKSRILSIYSTIILGVILALFSCFIYLDPSVLKKNLDTIHTRFGTNSINTQTLWIINLFLIGQAVFGSFIGILLGFLRFNIHRDSYYFGKHFRPTRPVDFTELFLLFTGFIALFGKIQLSFTRQIFKQKQPTN